MKSRGRGAGYASGVAGKSGIEYGVRIEIARDMR